MEKKDVLATLNGIFSEALKTPDLKLGEAMSAKDVDGWDSISNMIIISEIEKHYGIHFKLCGLRMLVDCVMRLSIRLNELLTLVF